MGNAGKIFVTAVVALAGFVLAFTTYKEAFVTNLQVFQSGVVGKEFFGNPVISGKILRGEFTAVYDNLGSVKIRITTYNRHNYDVIVFRLREKGTAEWAVVNSYAVDRFPNGQFYAFGFPVVPDSAGKMFEFEIESESGKENNAIGFLPGLKDFASVYINPSRKILQNGSSIVDFIRYKYLSLMSDPYFLAHLLMLILPVIVYVHSAFVKVYGYRHLAERVMVAGMFLLYILNPVNIVGDTILYIVLVAFIVLYFQRISGKNAKIEHLRPVIPDIFTFAIALILLMAIYVALGFQLAAVRSAISTYYVTVLGVIFIFSESWKAARILIRPGKKIHR